jgi:hypothetical protein
MGRVGSASYCVLAADKAAGLTTPRTAYTSIKPGQTVKPNPDAFPNDA